MKKKRDITFHIITLFPEMFKSYLGESILSRAIADKKITVKFYNPRDYTDNKWRRIDRKPYGGGPGLVIEALPVIKAGESALKNMGARGKKIKKIWLSPRGKQFTNDYAIKTAKNFSNIIIFCGRYEGIDVRAKKFFKAESVSVGPFVVTGGELPAMIIIDAISRQIGGVLHDMTSLEEKREASTDVYTRPEKFNYGNKNYRVPNVLLTGNHKKIDEWRSLN